MKSKLFNIDFKDLMKSALIIVLTTIITGLYQLIDAGNVAAIFEWISLKPILLTGLGAGIAYLLKNFVTNSNDKVLRKE